MRRRTLLGGIGALVLGRPAAAQSSRAEGEPFLGAWGVALRSAGGLRFKITIEFEKTSFRAYLAPVGHDGPTLFSERIQFESGRMRIEFPEIGGALEAQADGPGKLAGVWRQVGDTPIILVRDADFDNLPVPRVAPLTKARLEALRSKAGSPALIAMARGAGASVAEVVGRRDVDRDALATLEDLWHLGSITKSMTATLAAVAVQDGKLSWDAPLGDMLSEIAPEMREEYRNATLLHFLSHHTGIPPNLSMTRLLRFPIVEEDPRASRVAYVQAACASAPAAKLGEAMIYSNSGFVVVGALLERVYGVPWETLITERLFEPLGLSSAGFGAPDPALAPVGHTVGLLGRAGLSAKRTAYHPEETARVDNPAVLGPAGRVHMRLDDLLTYLEAHRDRSSLLRPDYWDRLHTPPFDGSTALGWIATPGRLWHNGSNTLWYAEATIDLRAGVVAGAAANDGALRYATPAVWEALAAAEAAVLRS